MSRTLISAAGLAAASFAGDASSSEIVFLPEGTHRIRPKTHTDGLTIHVSADRGPAIAAALQADLQKRLSDTVEPWFDFEHSRKAPKSGYPKGFRYQPGKGVMCSVEWSGAGLAAIRAKDVNHFSPEFYISDSGEPNGLPLRGPIGGLVSEPAFRMQPIEASAADYLVEAADSPEAMEAMERDPCAYEGYLERLAIAAGDNSAEERANAARTADKLEDMARQRVIAGDAPDIATALAVVCAEHDGEYRAAFAPDHSPGDSREMLQAAQDLDAEVHRLISAGEAATEHEALTIACQRDNGMYGAYLRTQSVAQ